MSHLVRHVLTEPQLLLVNTAPQHEKLDPPHEISQSLIGYEFLKNYE